MKIVTDTEHNSELYCIDDSGKQCMHLSYYPFRCTHLSFRAKGGYEPAIRTKDGKPKRCNQCIEATILGERNENSD